MLRHLPNALTVGNMLAGMAGLYFTLHDGDLYPAVWCILLAAVLDVFDGALARMLKVSSPIGRDLDSLADMVSFGVLPAFIMFHILAGFHPNTELSLTGGRTFVLPMPLVYYLPLLLAVCAMLRLAKFNNDPSQTTYFRGVPTPAMGLAMVGFGFQAATSPPLTPTWHLGFYTVLGASLVFSFLMVSGLPLLSFKLGFKRLWAWWLAIAVAPLAFLPYVEGLIFPTVILWYVAISQLYFYLHKPDEVSN